MAFSTSGVTGGAAQGILLGMSFGPGGALVGAGIGGIIGGIEGGTKAKMEKAWIRHQNQIIDQQRKLRDERNKLLLQETARAESELMKERAYIFRNTSEAINYIDRVSGINKADISVQNATADAIGASASIQYSAADASSDEARARAWFDQEVQLSNWQTSMTTMLKQARSMVDTTAHSPVFQQKDHSIISDGLLQLVGAAGSAYSKGMFDNIGGGNSYSSQVQSARAKGTGFYGGMGSGR